MANEDIIREIVRPGTVDPVVTGEIVVTTLDPGDPWIRLAIGDLTAASCGRTDMRNKGLGGPRRPDQQRHSRTGGAGK